MYCTVYCTDVYYITYTHTCTYTYTCTCISSIIILHITVLEGKQMTGFMRLFHSAKDNWIMMMCEATCTENYWTRMGMIGYDVE